MIPSKNKRYVPHGSRDEIKTALKSVFEFLLGDDALMLRIEIGDDVRLLLFRLVLQRKTKCSRVNAKLKHTSRKKKEHQLH